MSSTRLGCRSWLGLAVDKSGGFQFGWRGEGLSILRMNQRLPRGFWFHSSEISDVINIGVVIATLRGQTETFKQKPWEFISLSKYFSFELLIKIEKGLITYDNRMSLWVGQSESVSEVVE